MPELPEVETTVRGLDHILPGLTITGLWTDYNSSFHAGKDNIKNPSFFKKFEQEVVGKKVLHVTRRAKNILIHLSNNKTILVHMKMTGHLLYGRYVKTPAKKRLSTLSKKSKKETQEAHTWEHESWAPEEKDGLLDDAFNKFIHFVFILSNGKHVAFSDMRKFAKITLLDSDHLEKSADLSHLGPEPLPSSFTFKDFKERLYKKPKGMIKQVLMDQQVIAGIGNIYSDEILWYASVHPKSIVNKIPEDSVKKIYKEMKEILNRSISLGGDSMSDYRNLKGEKGGFHPYHSAYMQHGKHCTKKGCAGTIVKMKIAGRSAHFCPVHQILY